MAIKLKLGTIVHPNFVSGLKSLATCSLPARSAYAIGMTLRKLEPVYAEYNKAREAIIKEHGAYNPETKNWEIAAENRNAIEAVTIALNDLHQTEEELWLTSPIEFPFEARLTPQEMLILSDLIHPPLDVLPKS